MEQNNRWQHQPNWNGKFLWSNTAFLLITPLLALILTPWYLYNHGFSWWDFAIFFVLMKASGLSITAGYHRLFSHQTYEASPVAKFLLLVFGAGAFQNSALKWSSDHRYHHRFVDKEGDPYAITKGFFHAHMGWIFYGDPEHRSYGNAKDLSDDPLVKWQDKYYLPLSVLTGFLLPIGLGALVGRPFAGFIWGGLIRVLWVHHGTFLINSLAHTTGARPYSTKNSARDNWWLAFFTNGEGYHNFHHAFANDYRNGLRWYQWDDTKWTILLMQSLGHAFDLKRTPEAQILKAKLESAVEQHLTYSPQKELPEHLENMRAALELKIQEFQQKLREFQAWKETRSQENARWRAVRTRYWKRKLHAEKLALEHALAELRAMLRLLQKGVALS
jgi:stearoyl-CoA desaturase (delta-9 desaturase)